MEIGVTIKGILKEKECAKTSLIKKDAHAEICGKCCAAFFMTSIMSPFIICDLYFAFTDNSCSDQQNKIDVTMRAYLFVSGIIGLIFITVVNFQICLLKLDDNKDKHKNMIERDESFGANCLKLFGYIYRMFHLAWLMVGCIMFWGYMDISKCSTAIYSYLLARFIIAIIATFITAKQEE